MSRCTVALRTVAVLMVLRVQGVWGGDPYMSIVPIGTGPAGELAPGAVISGNAITLTTDGVNSVPVFLEIRIGDWDPSDTGTTLAEYHPVFDFSSLTSGASGALTFNVGWTSCAEWSDNGHSCYSVEDCPGGTCNGSSVPCHDSFRDCPSGESCVGAATCDVIANGNDVCEAEPGAGALFGPSGNCYAGGTRRFAYVEMSRPDFVLANALSDLFAEEVISPGTRSSSAAVIGPLDDPEPFPVEGLYGATIALLVPPDAQGTFSISLEASPLSALSSGTGSPITPLALIPAQIRVNPGRCCFNLQLTPESKESCADGLTASECADQNGVIFFEAGGTCAEPCPAVCGDNVVNHCSEECDGIAAAACPGACQGNCRCRSVRGCGRRGL